MATINQTLYKLSKSKFRSSFKLSKKDIEYIKEKGIDVIENHARDFIQQKISPANPINDGKQTPMNGHPVFKAMHATATCCRGCLEKWYHVPKGVELSRVQQEKILHLIMVWIDESVKQKDL